MYSGDIIVHTENHKESTKILWEMISKYTHVFGYDFNIWMSVTFLQTINEQFEFEMKKKYNTTYTSNKNKTLRYESSKICTSYIWGKSQKYEEVKE